VNVAVPLTADPPEAFRVTDAFVTFADDDGV
jgi:hypothetical protein